LPDYLPLPVELGSSRVSVPLIPVTFDSSIASRIRGGIPYDAILPWDPRAGASCQAVFLLPESSERALSDELQTRVVRLVETLGNYLGKPIDARLLTVGRTPEEPTRLAGFVLDEQRFGHLAEGTMADYAQLVEHLAGIWWGGGCRIAGPQGEMIESIIRLAVMMHLACRSATNSEAREAILRDWEADSDLALPSRLCRHLGAGSVEGLQRIRQLTASSWGQWVPERVVLEAMAPVLNSLR